MKHNIRIIQANLQNSREVTNDFLQQITNQNYDIAIVQEPYLYKNKLTYLGSQWTTIQKTTDSKINSIIIIKKNFQITSFTQYMTENIAIIKTQLLTKEITIISVYCPPKNDIVDEIEHLDKIIQNIGSKNLIIAGNINAINSLALKKTDERGTQIEQFINKHKFNVVYEGHIFTFETTQGQENIDITITTQDLENTFTNWTVQGCISDHNYITFLINETTPALEVKNRLHKQINNWDKINQELKTQIQKQTSEDIETNIRQLQESIRTTCKNYRNTKQ